MKTYFSNIVSNFKSLSKKISDVSTLKDTHWRMVDENSQSKVVFIFRNAGELLISENGSVITGRWEYLKSGSILIEMKGKNYLFNSGFHNEYVLGLNFDGLNEYVLFVNDSEIDSEINSIDELNVLMQRLNNDSSSATNEVDHRVGFDQKDYIIIAVIMLIILLAIITLIAKG